MDLIIFSGQSNMQGQTECNPNDQAVLGATEYKYLTNTLAPLQNPVGEDIGNYILSSHLGNGSLVPYFCDSYVKNTGKEVVAVHVAKGATIISEWQKDSNDFHRYEVMTDKIKGALKFLNEKPNKIHLVWLQGESDALAHTTKEDYKRMLTKFKNDLKDDIGIDTFGIILVGYFASHYDGKEYDEAIQEAQLELCKEDKDFVLLTEKAKELSKDDKNLNPDAVGHYNNASMKIIGACGGEALAKLQ